MAVISVEESGRRRARSLAFDASDAKRKKRRRGEQREMLFVEV